jgi:hypothetical protein
MAVWRHRALELLPELRPDLEAADSNIYMVFSELRPRLDEAHDEKDEDFLKRAYGFAAWCAAQKAQAVWNAAGVSFYEGLFDRWERRHLVVPWLSPKIISDHLSLWEARLTPTRWPTFGLFSQIGVSENTWIASNTRVQRTRSSPSPPHSPLTRSPLGAVCGKSGK